MSLPSSWFSAAWLKRAQQSGPEATGAPAPRGGRLLYGRGRLCSRCARISGRSRTMPKAAGFLRWSARAEPRDECRDCACSVCQARCLKSRVWDLARAGSCCLVPSVSLTKDRRLSHGGPDPSHRRAPTVLWLPNYGGDNLLSDSANLASRVLVRVKLGAATHNRLPESFGCVW